MIVPLCRFCGSTLDQTFCDLGKSPLANSYLDDAQINESEKEYPLHVYVCRNCFLVQLPEHEDPVNIFTNYSYSSSYSKSWLEHAKHYVSDIVHRFKYNSDALVVEIASNDGYLLQYFKDYNIRTIGIEPAKNIAEIAEKKGIETIKEFFGQDLAEKFLLKHKRADLIIANNVLAHVPDINDFVAGMKVLLDENGVITIEFPHLLNLINYNQFDTIYHEHYSYLSLNIVSMVLIKNELRVFDIDELNTHGGSLRIYACHENNKSHIDNKRVNDILTREKEQGLLDINKYRKFNENVISLRKDIIVFLKSLKVEGKSIVAYGAAAKGNTLLNYCNINPDLIEYVVDLNPGKQGKYLPGSHIPIKSPEFIVETKPDFILILPWNIKDEIMEQLSYTKKWGCQFIVLIPELVLH